jgi:flagellin
MENVMGLRISTNIPSLATTRILGRTAEGLNKSYQRLASGQRIVRSGDDAAGLSISDNLRASLVSFEQAQRNAQDGVSVVQVAEGGMTEIGNILIRLRELAIQAASDTVGDRERAFIHQESQSLIQEVDRIANSTNYNGTPLLNAQSQRGVLAFQVGINNSENDRIFMDTHQLDVRAAALGIDDLSFETADGALDVLGKVDEATGKLFSSRANLGALQNKLQSAVRNLDVTHENLAVARSRIADADIAKESSELTRLNILQSSGIAVLAQANSAPMQALKLID